MNYDVGPDLKRLGKRRAQTVLRVAGSGQPDGIHGTLVLALYSRETNCRNVAGGAKLVNGEWVPLKSDRGLAQINDFYWKEWLAAHKGCAENTYQAISPTCLPEPLVPRLTDQTRFCCDRLATNYVNALKADYDPLFALHVSVSAYNAGSLAFVGASSGHMDPDRYTAQGPRKLNGLGNGDYGKDILDRQSRIRLWLREHDWLV